MSQSVAVKRILNLIGPNAFEIVCSVAAVVLMLSVAFATTQLDSNVFVGQFEEIRATIGLELGTFFNQPWVTSAVSLLFWGLVGLILFSLCWSLLVVIIDIRNDVIVSEYFVHPSSFHKSDYLIASLFRRIVAITSYGLIFFYIVLLLRSLPIVFQTYEQLFLGGWDEVATNSVAVIVATVSWLLGWHLIVIVRRFYVALGKTIG